MIDKNLKVLEFQESFYQSMPKIIEWFVSFYGEDKREKIESKFGNAIVIPYFPLEYLRTMIGDMKREKTKELIQKFKERTGINAIFIANFFPSFSNFDENILLKYYKNVIDIKEHGKDYVDLSIKTLDSNITVENILADNKTELMKIMEENKTLIEELMGEYSDFYKKIEKYDKMVSIDIGQISNDVLYQYVLDHKELLGDEFESIEQEYKEYGHILLSNHIKLKIFFGSMDNATAPIFSFDEESDETLKTSPHYNVIETILDDRIAYFKMMGIDLGDDYSRYENDERCKKMWPTKEIIDYYKKEHEKYRKIYSQKVLEQYPMYVEYKKIIDGIPFMEEVNLIDFFMFGGTAVEPNFIKKDGEIQSLPLVFLNMSSKKDALDMDMIHEFNHLYELATLSVSDDEYHLICGWDLLDAKFKTKSENTGNRKYELFNEIINDLIAEAICKEKHKKGEHIISSHGEEIYRNAAYRRTEFLVAPFVTTFGKQLIKTREGDINALFDLVGKENVDEFCELFVEFNENFGGLKILNWSSAVKKGEKTELTDKREDIERRRDEILAKMIEYSKTQKKTM